MNPYNTNGNTTDCVIRHLVNRQFN